MTNLNPIAGIAAGVMDGLDDLFTSDEERAEAKLRMEKQLQQPHVYQAMTTLQESKHASVWVAGWRPAIGWTCATGLAYQFLLLPFAGLINSFTAAPVDLPAIQASELMTLTLSLLGLGGLRTYEKLKGITK